MWISAVALSLVASGEPASITTDIQQFFSGEEAKVLIEVRVGPGGVAPKLLRTDASGAHVKLVGVLNDEGVFGDRKARDGVFSKRVLFKERRVKDILLRVEGQTEIATLHVVARPTLQEILRGIWARFRHTPA